VAKRLSAAERMQKICLALPDVKASDHFGSTAYSARGKMFATFGEKDGECVVVVQVEPEQARALLADPRNKPYSRLKDTVMIPADSADWQQMESLILQSYRLNVPPEKVTKKAKAVKKPAKKKGTNKK
jgi:predicted DNA-binding protein (MmcQ/YjbR family)